jgi:hypothetical protein
VNVPKENLHPLVMIECPRLQPIRARNHRNLGARWRISALDAGSRGFCRFVPPDLDGKLHTSRAGQAD